MFKRLRLKIKKQRELEGMKKYQNVLTSWNTKREIGKKRATKLIQSWNYFFWRKLGTNSEISKLESNNDLKD